MTDTATAATRDRPAAGPTLLDVDGYRVELVGDIGAVDRVRWNAAVIAGGGGVFHSHEWHTAVAEAPPGRMRPAHLVAYRGTDLVGICPAYLVESCPRLAYALSLERPRDLPFDQPVLLAHGLAALTGGPLAEPGEGAALRALDAGLQQAARVLDTAIWGYANLTPSPFSGWLLGQGYAVAETATDYHIAIRWDSVDDYWASIPGRRRRALRNERNRALRAGTRVAQEALSHDETVRLAHLLLAQRGTPANVLPEPFLGAVLRHLAPYERSVTARDAQGRPQAVFAGWEFGGDWSVWLAGLDTEHLDAFTPYHAMIAATMDSAVGDGVAQVDLGRANGAIKRRYGCRPRPLLLALKSADRSTDALLHLWCRNLQQRHHAALNGLETTSRCC